VEAWRRNQFAVTAAVFVGFTGFTLVMPFLALYFRELGVSGTADVALWTGVTLGVTPLVAALCSPFWGRIGDRFGNKILVQRSLLSFIVVMVLMAYATDPWQLFALRAVQGFVAGYGALSIAMVARSAPPEHMATAIGTVQVAQRIAPAFGPVVGGVLASAVGLRNVFFVAAAIYAVAFLLLTVLYHEPPRTRHAVAPGDRVSFSNILALENFLLLMAVIFGLQMVDRSFGPVLPLHLEELGYSAEGVTLAAGGLFSVLAIAGAAGNRIASVALPRASARVLIASSAVAAAGALGVFAWGHALWTLLLAMLVFGLGIGVAMTTAFTAAGSVLPREAHGAGFGFLTGASLVGSALSPIASGLMAAQSIPVVFVAGVVVLAVLAVVVRRVMVEPKEVEAAPPTDET
jgi:DHA1 family multidrug resistance protein-like MFS transporter